MTARTQTAETVDAVDEHGRAVQSMFSSIAHGYDRANRLMSLGADRRWREIAAQRLFAGETPSGAHVLDLCAGTLDSSKTIHRVRPGLRITAGDFSVGMLETGKRTLNHEEAAAITPVEMDAHELPLPDASIDAAYCGFGMRNLSDLDRALRELHRVMLPEARLVVIDFFQPRRAVHRAIHNLYNRTLLPMIGWACTGNRAAYTYLPRSIGAFRTTDDFRAALERRQFEIVEVIELMMGVTNVVVAHRRADAG